MWTLVSMNSGAGSLTGDFYLGQISDKDKSMFSGLDRVFGKSNYSWAKLQAKLCLGNKSKGDIYRQTSLANYNRSKQTKFDIELARKLSFLVAGPFTSQLVVACCTSGCTKKHPICNSTVLASFWHLLGPWCMDLSLGRGWLYILALDELDSLWT